MVRGNENPGLPAFGKKRKPKGWEGEPRRHMLARMGFKTVLPDGRRLDVSNFVARGFYDEPIHDEKYKGYTIEIWPDETPENPREWDNLGIMVYGHGRYILGDETFDTDRYEGWEDLKKHLIEDEGAIVILPLYLYDHSGITMNTTGFSCPWDSGQVGFIYVNKQQIDKIGPSDTSIEKLEKYLKSEVEQFDDYLTGRVYGYKVLDPDGVEIDSCWGFYGDYDESGLMDEVRAIVDNDIKMDEREQFKSRIRTKERRV